MKKISIKFITDFTPYPGTRSRDISHHSAEEFYEDLLEPKYIEAIANGVRLTIDLDGAAGYAGSFLDEAFGRLGHEFGLEDVKYRLEIISTEEPYLVEDIFHSVEVWAKDGIHYNSSLSKDMKLEENNYFTSIKKKG
jgi:hypothetical protein